MAFQASYANPKKIEQPNINISPSPLGISEQMPRRYPDNISTSYQSETPAPLNRVRNSMNDILSNEHSTPNYYANNTSGWTNQTLSQNQSGQTLPTSFGSKPSFNGLTKFGPPQQTQISQQYDQVYKRVWVKKASHTATTISVGPNDIVDDLKYMISKRFPTTLAVSYDPSDLVLKLQIPLEFNSPAKMLRNGSNSNHDESMFTSQNDSIICSNSTNGSQMPKLRSLGSDDTHNALSSFTARSYIGNVGSEMSRSATPLSPEPLKSSLPNKDQLETSWRQYNTRFLVLEPDLLVWSVLDKFFPNGMQMSDALIIETADSLQSESGKAEGKPKNSISYQTYTRKTNAQAESTTMSFPKPIRPTSNNKIAILGEQKVPKPRFKSINLQENPVPQSAAVILFSKDVRDDKEDTISSLPSPSAKKNFKESSLVHMENPPMRQTSSTDSHKKLSLHVDTNDMVGNSKDPPTGSTLIAAPTPRSDITITPQKPNTESTNNKLDTKAKNKKLGLSRILVNINVLVVEDNLVNQKIMARHLKSCGVQFKIASTGQEALEIWKEGGFHLCFMDIQLPVMSGIEVTKEIRRLERLNNIGSISSYEEKPHMINPTEDTLDLNLFRSPIIIVALTASSGASDQQNALAAGCNDYLTKPVQLKWLKNKLTEWGYMQALINFDYFKLEDQH
ncbi:hypothetical protein CANINC_002693 [Pichia inconspicua]|uniref:Response regulatory domain-containing protein n=1 Tax=Pichia inconspicua TaxID=52247 RepID=A0A4T0X0X5_9ASCO|nr:hypothetical protein CANINC_002693 [[Candida] inconspicua]